MNFNELNISADIKRAIDDMGFQDASPIQEKAIPIMMQNLDMIGQAQTGTGKTAAFGIPILEKVDPDIKTIQALVLCPTRELAIQVSEEIRKLAKYKSNIKTLAVYGGQQIMSQIKPLKSKNGVQIVVGTPGRVMDLMRRKVLKLKDLSMVVLDEADEMLNMGFREDIETILQKTPEERQTVLFSATMPKEIERIAKTYQKDSILVKVMSKELTVENIKQYYCQINHKDKQKVLVRYLESFQPNLSVVFCNTKKMVDEVVSHLKDSDFAAEGLHGDMKQSQRDVVMRGFRKGSVQILVATDVAARGIDVDDIDMIFNYDLPQETEFYVHRIGRTGRAGKEGVAISFITKREMFHLFDIERYCKTHIELIHIPSKKQIQTRLADSIFEEAVSISEKENLNAITLMLQNKIASLDNPMTEMEFAAALYQRELEKMNRIDNEHIEEFDFSRNSAKKGSDKRDFGKNGGKKRRKAERGMTRLFINIGKSQKVKPGDILGAIAGEANITSKKVGAIDMFDNYSFVDVTDDVAKKVLKAMKNAKIRGKKVHVEESGR